MEVQNNPAGRLHEILAVAFKANPQSPLRVVWSQALGCSAQDHGELLRLWSELVRLAQEAKRAIANLDDVDEALFLAPFKNIDALLAKVNFDGRWSDVKSLLDNVTMVGLRYGADRLKREGGASLQLSKETVITLTDDLDAMLNQVLDSDLPHKLKLLFSRNLEQLRQALLSLRLSGAEGLEFELDRIMGAVYRHTNEIQKAIDDGEDESLISGFFGVINRFNEAVSFGQNVATLAIPTLPALSKLLS